MKRIKNIDSRSATETLIVCGLLLGPFWARGQTGQYYFTLLAGRPGAQGFADGTGDAARFNRPAGVALDHSNNLYIADSYNHVIRKVTPAGVVTTLAGSPGQFGHADGVGSAAGFYCPFGVALDGAGNVYVADTYNHVIRKVTPGGAVTTLAGSPGRVACVDGIGAAARFFCPSGLAVDASTNVYIADSVNSLIRRLTPEGMVTTLAGSMGQHECLDGAGSAASFGDPTDVALDGAGILYVVDAGANTIRRVTPAGVVTSLAGGQSSILFGSDDGIGNAARFHGPSGVAVDALGIVYVADAGNYVIRRVTPDGVVTTLAGNPLQPGCSGGIGSAARFNTAYRVTVDSSGNLYVADDGNNVIFVGQPVRTPALSMTVSLSQVILAWDNRRGDFSLERTSALGGAVGWRPLTNSVQVVGTSCVVTDGLTSSAAFYRLTRK